MLLNESLLFIITGIYTLDGKFIKPKKYIKKESKNGALPDP